MGGQRDGIVEKIAAKFSPLTRWVRKRKQPETPEICDRRSNSSPGTEAEKGKTDEVPMAGDWRKSKRSRIYTSQQFEDESILSVESFVNSRISAELPNQSSNATNSMGRSFPSKVRAGAPSSVNTASSMSNTNNYDNEIQARQPSLGPIVTPEKMIQGTLAPQSDESRRLLRKQFRKLNDIIKNTSVGIEMEKPNSFMFQEVVHKNNLLYSHVQYTREAVVECQNFTEITNRLGKQFNSVESEYRFDVTQFCTKLKEKFASEDSCNGTKDRTALKAGKFDWSSLGEAVGTCYRTVPRGTHFMKGTLGVAHKIRQRRPRRSSLHDDMQREEEIFAETQSNEGKKKSGDLKNSSEVVESRIRSLQRKIREKYIEKQLGLSNIAGHKSEPLCMIETLFDPTSFTKTVENMFYTTFLVSKNQVSVGIKKEVTEVENDEGGGTNYALSTTPVIAPVRRKQMQKLPPPKQAIVSLNISDWRALVSAYQFKGTAQHDDETHVG